MLLACAAPFTWIGPAARPGLSFTPSFGPLGVDARGAAGRSRPKQARGHIVEASGVRLDQGGPPFQPALLPRPPSPSAPRPLGGSPGTGPPRNQCTHCATGPAVPAVPADGKTGRASSSNNAEFRNTRGIISGQAGRLAEGQVQGESPSLEREGWTVRRRHENEAQQRSFRAISSRRGGHLRGSRWQPVAAQPTPYTAEEPSIEARRAQGRARLRRLRCLQCVPEAGP